MYFDFRLGGTLFKVKKKNKKTTSVQASVVAKLTDVSLAVARFASNKSSVLLAWYYNDTCIVGKKIKHKNIKNLS